MATTLQPPSIYAGSDAWGVYRGQQQEEEQANSLSTLLIAEEERKRKESQQAALDKLIQFGVENPGREHLNTSASSEAPAQAPSQSTAPTGTGSNAPTSTIKPTAGRDIYGVNAAEGANRVNANTGKFGVSATQDANGNITLSNVGTPQGTWYAQPGTASMPNVSNDLFAAINSLKTTNDVDVARGLLSTIRESSAQKSSELMGEAMRFASTKLGVPVLEQQLREAEAADRADPAWYPGIGDSPITAKIRSALLTTRSSVDNEAKNYLASNTTYASMNAALKTAEEEAKRITSIGDRANRIGDEMLLRDQLKKDAKVDEANALRATMSPEEQKRLMVLNPTLASIIDEGDRSLAMAASIKRADRDANMRAALGATDMDLPILAMERNPDAVLLTVRKEQELNPAASDNEVQARIEEVSRIANGKDFVKLAVSQRFNGRIDSTEAKAYAAELSTSDVGLDAKGKVLKRQEKYAMALDLYRKDATNRFAGDTTGWKVNDPEFLAAQEKAFKVTGKRDMTSVLTSYLDGADAVTKLQRLDSFKKYAEEAAGKQARSLFGAVDTIALNAAIAKQAQTSGIWAAMLEVLRIPSSSGTSMAPLGILGAISVGAQSLTTK